MLVAIPVLVVFGHVFVPVGEVWGHLVETVLFRYLANTAWLVLAVGVGTFVVGTGTAWLVTMCRFPGRGVLEWALLLPLAVPAYAIAYTYAGLFDFAGPVQSALRGWFGWSRGDYWFPPVRTVGGAGLVLTVVLYPYVYLLARAAFLEQSVCVLEIGRTLGRGPWRIFTDIALPLARPAIATGVALALMETLSDFGTVQHFGVDTFTTGIYRTWFGLGDSSAAAQLAAVLLGIVFIIFLLERASRGRRRYHHTSRRYRHLPRFELRGFKAFAAVLACGLPLTLGFMLPGGQMIAWVIEQAGTQDVTAFDSDFWVQAGNTLILGAGSAVLAVALALFMSYAVRLHRGRTTRITVRLASMGYAVPGSVIAVGVLLPFGWLDHWLNGWTRDLFGISPGLIFSGTLFALFFAYLVRFLAVSLNSVEASLGKVTPSMDGAARSLGLTPLRTVFRVHVPIISPSLLTAGLLVLVDVMKELPATLILRPFDFNTLAVRAFELASDEQLQAAAAPALAIVVVGLAPVIVLSRAITRSRPGETPGEAGVTSRGAYE